MTGHRSLAEMYAKEVLSDVKEGAVDVSLGPAGEGLILTGLCIVLHLFAAAFFSSTAGTMKFISRKRVVV